MAVLDVTSLSISKFQIGIQITKTTDTVADWSSVANDTYFYDKGDELIHYKDLAGSVLKLYSSSGISGTTNYISKFTSSSALGDSLIQDDGTTIGVGTGPLANYTFRVVSSTDTYTLTGENSFTSGGAGLFGVANGVTANTNYGGFFSALSSTTVNIGGYGKADQPSVGKNIGLRGAALNGASNYSIQLTDGSQGVGKVLTCMTASGEAQWVALAAAAGIIYITNQTTGVVTYYTTLELASAGAVSGDTIYVNTGTYVVTTTATNGIAKSGVNWYFQPGSIINKATTGDIFNDTAFALPCKVYGQGSFNKTVLAGYIYNSSLQYSEFNALDLSSTVSLCIQVSGNYTNINIRYAVSTAAQTIYLYYTSYSNIKFKYIKSTATITMQMSGGGYNNIIGELVESTVTKAIYLAESNNNLFNVSYVSGTGNAGFDSYYSSYTFNGNTNYLYPFGGTRITFNGYAATIKSSSTITGGAICTSLVVNGDYGDSGSVTALIQGSGSITVSAGVANIKLSKSCTYLATTVSGGVLNFENTRFEDGYFYGAGYDFVISGGRVNLNNLQSELVDRSYSFKLTGGILDLGSSRTKNNSSNFVTFANTNIGRQSGIYWTGGTIISNGARIITQTDDCLAIQAVSSGLSMKVLSGGFNTTNTTNITTAKKQKVKCTVSSVLSTSITLNDGSGGDEIFTEANTGVYNTLALLAQRMVSLINASATLDITATQDTPGTDAYFYLESDVAGTAFTIPTYANIGIVLVRPNSNSFTVLCGGSIIQDINID